MDSNLSKKIWISKDNIYKPVKKGGLSCIILDEFLHAITINWMHRYITLGYDDLWTSLLDMYLGTTKTARKKSWNGDHKSSTNQ